MKGGGQIAERGPEPFWPIPVEPGVGQERKKQGVDDRQGRVLQT